MKTVVFDFDGTVVRGDSFGRFIASLVVRNPLRFLAAVAVVPVGGPLLLLFPTLGGSLFLWVATVAMSRARLESEFQRFVRERFVDRENLYTEAMLAIERHLRAGDVVWVASGCESALLQPVCTCIGIDRSKVVGSTTRKWFGGMVSERHCVGANKVEMLKERTRSNEYDHVYTDSALDLPLTQCAKQVTLVNAKSDVVRRARARSAAVVEVVRWESRCSLRRNGG